MRMNAFFICMKNTNKKVVGKIQKAPSNRREISELLKFKKYETIYMLKNFIINIITLYNFIIKNFIIKFYHNFIIIIYH